MTGSVSVRVLGVNYLSLAIIVMGVAFRVDHSRCFVTLRLSGATNEPALVECAPWVHDLILDQLPESLASCLNVWVKNVFSQRVVII